MGRGFLLSPCTYCAFRTSSYHAPMNKVHALALLGPPPPSRTKAYYNWRYRYMKLTNPAGYQAALARKRKTT